MSYSDFFKDNFYNKLLSPSHPSNPVRNRAVSFGLIFDLLDKKEDKDFLIVETGCMRADHGTLAFGDDGASTYIFDNFVNYYNGEVLSVDINCESVKHAQSLVSDKTKVHCSDSVKFLYNLKPSRKIDLLYLDSFDIIKNNPHPSQLHHLKELCAVIDKLSTGTIICVDDNNPFFTTPKVGKGEYVKDFMLDIGLEPIHDDYQIVWILP